MAGTTEAFSRVRIDALLADAGWNLADGVSVLFEHALPDGSRADYVLCNRAGRPMAVVEAKRASVQPLIAQDQGIHYATLLDVPFVFLSNGEEVRFLDRDRDAHARGIATFYSQDDLERRIAARSVRRPLADIPIDRKIVDRGYQIDCIEALSAQVAQGRRKLLVEMATGTGKTRTAAAFVKRLFEAGAVTPRPLPGGPDRTGRTSRGRLHRPPPRLSLPRTAPGPRLRPRQAHHHRDLADHDRRVPHALVGLLRSGDHRRVPPLDLRQVERRGCAISTASSWA